MELTFGTNYRDTGVVHFAAFRISKGQAIPADELTDVEGSVILTRKEVEELLSGAWEAGIEWVENLKEGDDCSPDKQQYINSILLPTNIP